MKNYIYCTTTAKGEQTFYLMVQGIKRFLFVQAYRKSNKEVFGRGVSIFDLGKLKRHCSYSVRHTAAKLPAYVHYIEQEYGVTVMETTKRKRLSVKHRKMSACEYRYYDVEVA